MSKCLQKVIDKMLKENPDVEVCSILVRPRGSRTVVMNALNRKFKLSDEKDKILEYAKNNVIMQIFTLKKTDKGIEYPAAAGCPWYGCLDCDAPDCDEECPQGECN